AEDVGLLLVAAVRVEDDVDPALDITRWFDARDVPRSWQADVLRDVLPLLAAVATHPEITVVGANIEQARVLWRLGEGGGGALVGRGDLRRDDAQVLATVVGAKDVVARRVEDFGVMRGDVVRRVPVEAQLTTADLRRLEADDLARAEVAPAHAAPLHGEVNQVVVLGIDATGVAVAAVDEHPVLVDRPKRAARPRR